jgi:tRNA pseudouridine38-40 synthase
MVATAVGVSRGVLPQDIIPISLCRHARVVLPLAPSEGLVLAKNSFYPYRQLAAPAHEREFLESEVGLARLRELPKLEISRQMMERVDSFWSNVVLPKLAPQLDGSLPLWSDWLGHLWQGAMRDHEIDEVRDKYNTWRVESQLKMEAAAADEALARQVRQDRLLQEESLWTMDAAAAVEASDSQEKMLREVD